MNVGRVLVFVLDVLVAMRMRVLSDERRIVRMGVVPVVMSMRVLVLDRGVDVAMTVPLAHVQVHAEPEQPGGGETERARVAIAERPRDRGSDERREREHRTGTPCPDASLRQ